MENTSEYTIIFTTCTLNTGYCRVDKNRKSLQLLNPTNRIRFRTVLHCLDKSLLVISPVLELERAMDRDFHISLSQQGHVQTTFYL
jgi:hypothetical protein